MAFMSDRTTPLETTMTLSLTVKNGNEALDFYARALGAEVTFTMPSPDGGLAHGEFCIGNTRIYISDESPQWHAVAMPAGSMASCLFGIATEDCDAAYRRAIEAGATSLSEPADQFYGVRSALVLDPYGYRWSFGQRIEELSDEEIQKRADGMFGGES